jgi:hypothetical protein
MMSRKWSNVSRGASYQRFTQTITRTIVNTSHETVIVGSKSITIQHWINGMIIGSAPFLIILFCWIFVSLCINNLVRFYLWKKNRYKQNIRNSTMPSKINI